MESKTRGPGKHASLPKTKYSTREYMKSAILSYFRNFAPFFRRHGDNNLFGNGIWYNLAEEIWVGLLEITILHG